MKMTKEINEKARQAKNVEELMAIAKENEVELTEESAKAYFDLLHPQNSEVSDDELDNVAGGTCYKDGRPVVTAFNSCERWVCERCGKRETVADGGIWGTSYKCPNCGLSYGCGNCHYSRYESALLLCFHPERYYN